jgi:hypothetical protein
MSKLPGLPKNKWARWFWLLLWLLLLSGVCQAQRLLLVWNFPRDYTPAPDNFILSQTQNATPEKQSRVALSAEGACPGIVQNVHDTFCTMLTQCPAPGTITAYWVYAQWGTTFSTPSNIATCYTRPGEPCVCHDPLDKPPPPKPEPRPLPPLANEPPTQQETTPPTKDLATTAPQILALANPTVPVFRIPAVPASAGT